MKKRERYRVLLMCTKCDKVYNGTGFINYEKAIRIHHTTLLNNKDTCKNKDCGELLIAQIQDMEKKDEENDKTN